MQARSRQQGAAKPEQKNQDNKNKDSHTDIHQIRTNKLRAQSLECLAVVFPILTQPKRIAASR